MALTKVSGPLLHGSNDNLGNYVINNITGAAATFTGNVSIGGTLTYDDVTNVESVGIVTAKGGLHVGAGGTIIYALSEDGGKVGINTTDASHLFTVYAQSASSVLARFKAVNRNSNFDVSTDASSHGSASVRNNIGAIKVHLNSNGDSYFTGGNVGINTSSPTEKLDVHGVGIITGGIITNVSPAITIRDGTTVKGYIGFNANDPFIGRKSGVGLLFQDNKVRPVDGDTGIGTNNTVSLGEPTFKFKDLYLEGDIHIDSDVGQLRIGADEDLKIDHNGSNGFFVNTTGGLYRRSDGHIFESANGSTEYARITSAGKVGIGTNDPTSHLQVYRQTQFASNPIIQARSNNGSSNELKFEIDGDGDAYFNGNVGINSTSPDGTLVIHGNSGGNPGVILRRDTGGGDVASIRWASNSANFAMINYRDAAPHGLQFYSGGTADSNLSMIIRLNGSVGIGSLIPTGKFDIAPGGNSFIKFGQDADNPKMEWFRSTGNASNTHYSVELQQILGDFIFSTAAAANLGSHSYGEKIRIKADGKILIGDDTVEATTGLIANIQTFGTDAGTSSIAIRRGSDDAQAAFLIMSKSRNTSVGSRTILQNGDEVGNIFFVADDGTDLVSNTAAIKSQIDGVVGVNSTPGNLTFWTTSDNANAATERARINSFGGLQIGSTPNVSALAGTGSGTDFTSQGMVLSTPAYVEYQYTWGGQSDYTITLTCGSYFHSEFIYVQHQTNGGNNMQNYARGKWANNHTTHTGYMYEFSGQGTNAAVTTTFTISDQNDNGTVNPKAGLTAAGTPGATYRGEYGGGSENTSSGTGSATGKFVIDETYNGSGLSASTRALIMRVYFGTFSISIA